MDDFPPPPPPLDIEPAEGTITVNLKQPKHEEKKKAMANVSVVESATRFWLSAQIMIACILLGMLALSIRDSRNTIYHFPDSLNASCSNSVYEVKAGISLALVEMLDGSVNFTNTRYQNSVQVARRIVGGSLNVSLDMFTLFLKQINPVIYCTANAGLGLVEPIRSEVGNITFPSISCSVGNNFDPCQQATTAINKAANTLGNIVRGWPDIPDNLDETLQYTLEVSGFSGIVSNLATFPAPDKILIVNSTEVIARAMANATAFDDMAATCTSVSVKFRSHTKKTADIMYYIEIAIWVAIAALLVGIFLVAIVRQFPTMCVAWFTKKIEAWTARWEARLDRMENNSVHTWQLYMIWIIKYINFKKAVLTTLYGLVGILLVYNLAAITSDISAPVEVWVDTSLSPGFDKMQDHLQDGINHVIQQVQDELNIALTKSIKDTLIPINGTLNSIIIKKVSLLNIFYDTLSDINNIDFIGPTLANGVRCMLPISAITLVDSAVTLMIRFLQDLMNIEFTFPKFTFPRISVMATKATHVAIQYTVTSVQDQLFKYQIVFIILSIAFGILLFQAFIFVGLKRLAKKIRKHRRQSRA